MRYLVFPTVLLLIGSVPRARADSEDVAGDEEARWLRWALPLPKQAAVRAKVILPASGIGLRTVGADDELVASAAGELRALFDEKGGAALDGGDFEIILGLSDARGNLEGDPVPGAAGLNDLPNRSQAYRICPIGGNRLILTALDGKGLFYAARTLCQFLESRFEGGNVTVPLLDVTDWPDLEERGEWGGSANNDIVWMAKHKMNLVESHVTLEVREDGTGTADVDAGMIDLGRRHALKVVPIIMHLDQLGRTGLFDVYPDLRGKGSSAVHAPLPTLCAPCASDPRFFDVLADWMAALAHHEGVTDVCAWLSEHHVKCGCEKCQKVGQYALETRGLVQGWERAREKHPGLRLRVLLTQGSYETNDKVLAECPPGVGVTYYHGGLTYNSSRDPMIYPLLGEFAANGRWLGCYPQLTASWRIVCPWSAPQFIRFRMQEFVDKGLRCLCGYATPGNRLYEFNILAAAEWSWNAHGRSPEEFALAWATRRGFSDPGAAAEWAVTLGPIGWDVYGSGVPYPWFFGRAASTVSSRSAAGWGEGMLRYFPTRGDLEKDLAETEAAMLLARRLAVPELIGETGAIRGYLRMMGAIQNIAEVVSGEPDPDPAALEVLQEEMNSLAHAAYRTCESLKTWEREANQAEYWRGRFSDTVRVTGQTARDIGRSLSAFRVGDPTLDLFGREVGAWSDGDFETEQEITKEVDVTEWISGPGEYAVEFMQTGGYHGLSIHRVALVDRSGEAPVEISPREIWVDEHEGTAKSERESTDYLLKLDEYDPEAAYALVADITGVRSSDQPENMRGCSGVILLRKVFQADSPLPEGTLRKE